MLKKVILLTAPTVLTLFLSVSAHGQDLPSGPLNRLINCSINPGKTMAQVVEWAKTQPVTDATPNAIFFREKFYIVCTNLVLFQDTHHFY